MQTVIGLFENIERAEQAIRELNQAGFADEQIGVLTEETAINAYVNRETGARDVASDAVKGGATGAVLGGLTGVLGTLAAVSIPGLGPALVGGTVASYLIGGAGGAGVGWLVGTLLGGSTDIARNRQKAEEYAERIRQGGVLVTVLAEGTLADQAQQIMERNGAAM
jgi:hypothetical protein